MFSKRNLFITLVMGMSMSAQAYLIGVSQHPFEMDQNIVTTEATAYSSGVGMQARYFRRMNENVNFDAGAGLNSGERSNRFFAGADYRLLPDYENQPRVSIKGLIENMDDAGNRKNILGFAPTMSKGLNMWGVEAFPFIAVPVRLALDSETKKYETQAALALGISGQLPFDGYRDITANLEGNIGLANTFSAVVLGFSKSI